MQTMPVIFIRKYGKGGFIYLHNKRRKYKSPGKKLNKVFLQN